MAIDTRNKRASVMQLFLAGVALPAPDGTIAAADRAHIAGLYGGIAVSTVQVGIIIVAADLVVTRIVARELDVTRLVARDLVLTRVVGESLELV